MMTRRHALSVITLALVAGACKASGPRALVSGEDACAYCRMTIDDIRFGAMVLTARGRIETFDSIECAASFVASRTAADAPRAVWVANFEHPSQWVDAARARFLHQSRLRSPMGRELAAFAAGADSEALQKQYGGRPLQWSDVLAMSGTPIRTGSTRPVGSRRALPG